MLAIIKKQIEMKEEKELNTSEEIRKKKTTNFFIIIFVIIILGLAYDLLFIK
jgi:uncharacterized membrane protein